MTKNEKLKIKLDNWWKKDVSARKNIDWKWFVIDLWVSGNHYARYDRNTQQIIPTMTKSARPKVVINKILSTLRAVRNFSLRNEPRPEVIPDDINDETLTEALKVQKYLVALADKLKINQTLDDVVWNALKYVGYVQVLWDENADNGKGGHVVKNIDPYDLYWDANANHPSNARRVTLAVKRNIDDLMHDDKYDQKEVEKIKKGDSKLSASDLKSRLIQLERGSYSQPSDAQDSIIVREHWYWDYDKNGQKKLMICAIAGDRMIRKPEETGLDRIPFHKLDSTKKPSSMYGESWVQPLIPLNKMINSAASSIVEYNETMNKVKFFEPKGSGVKVINNEHAQRVVYRRVSQPPQQIPPAPMNQAIYQQLDFSTRLLEDLGAAQDALLGRVPTGAKSGRAIEALQTGSANSLAEVTRNLENFVGDVYEHLLSLAATKYQFTRNVSPLNSMSEREIVTVIGEDAEVKPEGAVVIRKKNMVRVKMSSQLAHTPQARREAILELAQVMPDLPPEFILQAYEIGGISDIVQKLREAQKEKQQHEMMMQQQQLEGQMMQQQQGGQLKMQQEMLKGQNKIQQQEIQAQQQQQQTMQEASTKEQARSAIQTIMNGGEPHIPEIVLREYVDFIQRFIENQRETPARDMTPEILMAIQMFLDNVMQQSKIV